MLETQTSVSEAEMPFQKRFFFGVLLIWVGLCALWNNEVRFDLVSATNSSPLVHNISSAVPGENFSFSGRFDPLLKIQDPNVDAFDGYMVIMRVSEIYAWDRKKRSNQPETWALEWQRVPEFNSRNKQLQKKLKTRRLFPQSYDLGQLSIKNKKKLHFVDDYEAISPNDLQWQNNELRPTSRTSEYFYFSANSAVSDEPQLGDERLSYRGIPLPSLVTYFGRFNGESGVADTRESSSGRINKLIRNDGILHHLVAGERDTALQTIADYQTKLKLIIRLGGTAVVVIGIYTLLTTVFGVLAMIPVIGEWIASALLITSIVIGAVLSGLTITLGYLAANALVVAALCAFVVMVFYGLRRRVAPWAEQTNVQ